MVGTDMGSGLTREAIYDLRRLLIGRLQMATRGIPKSRRIEELQAFAREWQKLWATGGLGQLALLVDQKDSAVVLPEIFHSLARMTEPVLTGSEPEALANLSYPTAGPALRGAGGKPNSWWVGNRQGDLFPAGLALNPSREVPCSA